MASGFLIYGSYGHAGQLIAREAVNRGLRPILAGRDRYNLYSQGEQLGLTYRAFALADPAVVDAALLDVDLVLNCAGPFSHTVQALAGSCLRTRTHYLDLSEEVDVLEGLHALDRQAQSAGVALLPGVGLGVVAADCLAVHLQRRLPSATRLILALDRWGYSPRATGASMVSALDRGGLILRDGVVTPVPFGWKSHTVDFGRGPTETLAIHRADPVAAYYSTGIPHIEIYAAVPALLRGAGRLAHRFRWLWHSPLGRAFAHLWAESTGSVPDEAGRFRGESRLWAEAADERGGRVASRLRTPESYGFLAPAALGAVRRTLEGQLPPGFLTPSRALGPDFPLELPGVVREDVGR